MLLSVQFSSLLRQMSLAAQPSGVSVTPPPRFASPGNLLRTRSVLLYRSLMKRLTSTGPTIDPWGIPLVTCLQLDFATGHNPLGLVVLPIANPLSKVYFVSLTVIMMQDSVKGFTKVRVNNIHCFPLIHRASHLTVEGYQVGQASFPLCKSMLTTSNHLLVLHVF